MSQSHGTLEGERIKVLSGHSTEQFLMHCIAVMRFW